ncbi:helix-turn-helix transcriptional regulator [Streptomyces sp. NPDC048254]|uniref:helix-turn-helix transcriptional regulator n=1 Tax=Streptomyces sp. NPDC048254 TaxID=3365525 RepID=UPI00372383F1
MTSAPHTEHGIESLCAAGTELYERALAEGHISARDAAEAPCLVDLGLLHPALDDLGRLEPVAPAIALNRLLRATRAGIADAHRRENLLVDTWESLLRLGLRPIADTSTDIPPLLLHSGTARINDAITDAMTEADRELLCVQPHTGRVGPRGDAASEISFDRDQRFLDRGGRIRTLMQHSLAHLPGVVAYNEILNGDTMVRGLDELPDRLIVIDRTIAFLPADRNGTLALEVRHPALIRYLVTTFDRLWRLATPMFPKAEQRPTVNGITPRQQAIAALLVEGHTDAVIAERLGMNIRTARDHIAKLATTLGSESRAQLGYLIGRSGILDQEG